MPSALAAACQGGLAGAGKARGNGRRYGGDDKKDNGGGVHMAAMAAQGIVGGQIANKTQGERKMEQGKVQLEPGPVGHLEGGNGGQDDRRVAEDHRKDEAEKDGMQGAVIDHAIG